MDNYYILRSEVANVLINKIKKKKERKHIARQKIRSMH